MPVSMERVEEYSAFYGCLKIYVDFCTRLYFRVTIRGAERLHGEGTFILAPNHQNALMDALVVLSANKWQPVFLARADIFKKPTIRKILTFLKIMPVYRIRDGYSTLGQNDATFRKTMDVFRNRNGLIILPEGNHGDQKRLRTLKKGLARIAFQAEEEADGQLDLKVIPVGLDYTQYIRIGSHLHIRFGEPIPVAPLLGQYRENPAKGYVALMDLVAKGIRQQMVHIADEHYHNCIKSAIEALARFNLDKERRPITHEAIVLEQQRLTIGIEGLRNAQNDDYLKLMALFTEFEGSLRKLGSTTEHFPIVETNIIRAFLHFPILLLLSPMALFSFVNSLLPIILIGLAARRVKDPQFVSSFRFVLGLLLFPVFGLIQLVVFAVLSPDCTYTVAYAVSLAISAPFLIWWLPRVRWLLRTAKLFLFKWLRRDLYKKAMDLLVQIHTQLF